LESSNKNYKMLIRFVCESVFDNIIIVISLIISYSIRLYEKGDNYNWMDNSMLTLSVLIMVGVSSINKY